MPEVYLGNPRPIFNGRPEDDPTAITRIVIRDSDKSLAEAVRDVVHNDDSSNTGLWAVHSDAPEPSWVECDDPELEQALAEHYGCPIGRPADKETVSED